MPHPPNQRKVLPVTTREEATARGWPSYFTGLPCKQGHIANRSVKNGTCRACDVAKKTRREAATRRSSPAYAPPSPPNRATARAAGDTRYFGQACRKCSGCERWTHDGSCVVCGRKRTRENERKRSTLAGKLRRGAPRTNDPADTYVYVITAGPHSKIGVATDVHARLRDLQTGCPIPAAVAHVLGPFPSRTATWYERTAHRFFASRRTVGEWFEIPPQVAVDTLNALGVFE